MMRSNPSTSMQKTYDECHLICSTAVYFEKQNNEDEALRSWRNALDSIYYFNAYRVPATWKPKSETEKALQESLQNMETQCKERVDLLDALRQSRQDASKDSNLTNGNHHNHRGSRTTSNPPPLNPFQGSIGQGTVPPVNYSDLARPTLPPRPPPRPVEESKSFTSIAPSEALAPPNNDATQNFFGPPSSGQQKKSSRTPSPDKKSSGMFKSTLRPSKDGSRPNSGRLAASTMRNRPPAASKAATLAWPNAGSSALGPQSPGSNPVQQSSSAALYTPSLPSFTPHAPSPNPFDQLPQNAPSLDLPTRPRSSQPAPKTQSSFPKPVSDPVRNAGQNERLSQVPFLPPAPKRLESQPPPAKPASVTPSNGTLSLPEPPVFPSYRKEFPTSKPVSTKQAQYLASRMHTNLDESANTKKAPRQPSPPNNTSAPVRRKELPKQPPARPRLSNPRRNSDLTHGSGSDSDKIPGRKVPGKHRGDPVADSDSEDRNFSSPEGSEWDAKVKRLMKNLPKGVDDQAAKAVINEVVIQGDEVHWDDVAGLDIAKTALKEAVVYPFLRPDLFLGLREPARGMLLFGPPGTGKTMLARAVATESKSTFFAISASSLTSKFLGESEKLVRALFALAKALAPSIIFVDEIDSLLSARSGSGEHEATRRIKTEFLIQWSDLAKAAAGREDKDKSMGDATRVLVLAATNMPWAIDEAARRRFVRRQYIPLPEGHVRADQLRKLMGYQKHELTRDDYAVLVQLTDGFSGSDITALAKDAAMGPLRSLGEKLLHMSPEDIRPIQFQDFESSLMNIRPSVSKQGLKEYESWAKEFGERGG